MTSAKIISVALGFLLKVFIVRLLTKDDFGLIAVLTSLNIYFGMIADFSTHGVTQRNIINDKSNYKHHYHIYVNAKILATVISTFLFIITAYFLGYFEYTLIITILIINVVFGSFANLPLVLVESFKNFGLSSKIMIIVAIINLILQLMIVYIYQTVESLVIALLLVSFSSMYLYYHYIGKVFDVVYSVKLASFCDVKNLLKDSFPLFAGSFFYLLYYRIDTIMIEKIVGFEAAAEYNLGFSMADQVLEIFWVQFIVVFYPEMIRIYKESRELLAKKLKQVSFILIFVYGVIFIFSIIFSEFLFGFIFGEEYRYSGYIFSWTIVSMFFTSIFALYYRLFIIANKQGIYLYLMIFGGILNFVLNLYLIQKYGSIGAVIATLIVNFLILIIAIAKSYKFLGESFRT